MQEEINELRKELLQSNDKVEKLTKMVELEETKDVAIGPGYDRAADPTKLEVNVSGGKVSK
eukprot:11372275-Karenia_brevis.AAC.1